MKRIFQILGADWQSFKALLSVLLRIDFRGKGGGGKRVHASIVRSLIFYTLMGSTLAASLVSCTTPFMYAFLTLSYSMVMMAFSVILEFGHSFLNPDDVDILLHRPLTSRTYFLSKVAHVFTFIIILGTSLCFIPALLGLLVQGADWRFPLAYLVGAFAAHLCSAVVIVYLYTGLIRLMPFERFKDAMAYMQIGFTFIIFLAYQLIPQLGEGVLGTGKEIQNTWLYAVPSAWFAGMVRVLTGGIGGQAIVLMIIGIAVILLLAGVAFRRISLEYVLLVSDVQSIRRRTKTSAVVEKKSRYERGEGFFRWKRCLSMDMRAGFDLADSMLRKDRSVKMAVYPLFGFPLAMVALSILNGEFIDPFYPGPMWDVRMADLAGWFLFYLIYNLILTVRFSRHWEAGWIYHAAPVVSPGRLIAGVKLALLMRLIAPLFLLFTIVYSIEIPWSHAVQHTCTLALLSLIVLSGATFLLREFPFSKQVSRGDRTHRLAAFLLVLPLFLLLSLVQPIVYQNQGSWWLGMALILLVCAVLEGGARRRLNRILVEKEFFV